MDSGTAIKQQELQGLKVSDVEVEDISEQEEREINA